jgi:hypothetical protein
VGGARSQAQSSSVCSDHVSARQEGHNYKIVALSPQMIFSVFLDHKFIYLFCIFNYQIIAVLRYIVTFTKVLTYILVEFTPSTILPYLPSPFLEEFHFSQMVLLTLLALLPFSLLTVARTVSNVQIQPFHSSAENLQLWLMFFMVRGKFLNLMKSHS